VRLVRKPLFRWVTLITAKKNCFQESLKAIKTVGISKFVWRRVQDCRDAGLINAIRHDKEKEREKRKSLTFNKKSLIRQFNKKEQE